MALSKRQPQGDQELHYLGLAYRTLLDGLARCSSASMLNQYLGELEESVGRIENARTAFARALASRPADFVTRMIAARLEEREGEDEAVLSLLEEGVNHSPMDPELHYRIATLLAKLHPERDTEARSHFQAAILGPARRYRPRIAYAAYLFGQHAGWLVRSPGSGPGEHTRSGGWTVAGAARRSLIGYLTAGTRSVE